MQSHFYWATRNKPCNMHIKKNLSAKNSNQQSHITFTKLNKIHRGFISGYYLVTLFCCFWSFEMSGCYKSRPFSQGSERLEGLLVPGTRGEESREYCETATRRR